MRGSFPSPCQQAARPSPSPPHLSRASKSPGSLCLELLKADAASPGPCPTPRGSHVLQDLCLCWVECGSLRRGAAGKSRPGHKFCLGALWCCWVSSTSRTQSLAQHPPHCEQPDMVVACSPCEDVLLPTLQAVPGAEGFVWPDLLHWLGGTLLGWHLLAPLQRESAVAQESLMLVASEQMLLLSALVLAFVSFLSFFKCFILSLVPWFALSSK